MCLKEVTGNVHGNCQQRLTFKPHAEALQGTESVCIRSDFTFTRNYRNL